MASHTLPTALPQLSRRQGLYRNSAKRALDVVLVLAMLPIAVPMILILALAVMCDGHSPFYTQLRVGRAGREFRFWKLRSMVHDADARLSAHLASSHEALAEWNHSQKLKCDPRITRVGHFLRKSSLDELPQLWNVLKGDMSLVGPRPIMPKQSPLYPGKAYYALRPGLTGPWQISDRNECSFALRAEFDSAYDRELSFGLDLRILMATIRVVLRGTGY
ncbi:sugar transferase [Solirhodobacter olei]|uniref:sugar transferase n=1 Tax=Solirhodobacter olei TaxID=2493082 RepID=UPI001F4D48ED|nr:sugar transferase [Solirhodobacter olei]